MPTGNGTGGGRPERRSAACFSARSSPRCRRMEAGKSQAEFAALTRQERKLMISPKNVTFMVEISAVLEYNSLR